MLLYRHLASCHYSEIVQIFPPSLGYFYQSRKKFWAIDISSFDTLAKKIVIAPGCGFEEKGWGNVNYNRLVELILNKTDANVSIVGDHSDISRISPAILLIKIDLNLYAAKQRFEKQLQLSNILILFCLTVLWPCICSVILHCNDSMPWRSLP